MASNCTTCIPGDLATITFATSGFTATYTRINGNEITREVIEANALGSSTCNEKCPADQIDYGEIDLEFCYDPDEQPPFSGSSETAVLTFPPKSGQTNGATLTGTGFFRRFKVPDMQRNERMIAEATFVFDCVGGAPVFADGS